jgi:(1->4)-alpha-D-glucan 1-alpha-D-glucosylmutase
MTPPTSTYRLQLHGGFGFKDAQAIVEYLDALGVSHVYASPYLKAETGSAHGYNLVDPTQLNPEIGSEEAFDSWLAALRARGMGHVVDFVPNHMGIRTGENAWWTDVLENGRCSRFADYFDIDWAPLKEGLRGRVLLPILGAPYGEVLERGELALARTGGAFLVSYFERRLPVSAPTLAPLLSRAAARLPLAKDDPRVHELESIINSLLHLPKSDEDSEERREERAREKEIIKRRIDDLCRACPEACEAIDACVAEMNGRPGEPRSFDDLDALLREQCYRLSFWRVATEEINYRRFFEVNDLAAVRMDRESVFEHAHALLFRLIEEGRLDGLRLDHTDGLYDPAHYFAKLQARAAEALVRAGADTASLDPSRPLFVVAEKILAPGEHIPADWPIHGTTGYELGALLDGLWVDPSSEAALTAVYQRVTGDRASFADHVLAGKRAVMSRSLSSEVTTLARELSRLAEEDRRSRDFTLASLTTAIVETIANFQVYRTYVRADGSRGPDDEGHVKRATRLARRRNREINPSVFDFLRDVLLLQTKEDMTSEARAARAAFAMRFQQLTGPVMAKGVEDTAFYTYPRLISLNEVGNRSDRFGVPVAELHAENERRLRLMPLGMTTTSTHDSKRGEDARARISVLSEIPDLWSEHVTALRACADRYRTEVEEDSTPSGTDEYLFYQTVLGAFPFDGDLTGFSDRVAEYMIKAAREAKQRTSWLSPDEAYEQALAGFVRSMLDDAAFLDLVRAFSARVAVHGAANGLAQAVLKIASPGVPDIYQGSEVWNLALVDPDNRRPVDYGALRSLLARSEASNLAELRETMSDGALKLRVVRAALRLRRENRAIFVEGECQPIDAGEHVIAFARTHGGRTVVCLTARHGARLTGGAPTWAIGAAWGDRVIDLPPAPGYRCAISGRALSGHARLQLAEVFADLPVALLVSEA